MATVKIETEAGDTVIVDGVEVTGGEAPPPEESDVPALVARWEDFCGGTLTAPENAGHINVGEYSKSKVNTISVDVPKSSDPYFAGGFDDFKYSLMLEHFDANWPYHLRVYWEDGTVFYEGTKTTVTINIGAGRAGKRFFVDVTNTNGMGNGFITNQRYYLLGKPA